MKNLKLAALALPVLLLAACSTADTEGPSINTTAPSNPSVIHTGQILTVKADFADNEALNQYKIEIHSDHENFVFGKTESIYPAYDTIIIGNFTGTTVGYIDVDIPIQDGVWPGPYVIEVYGLDKSGNETMVELNLTIEDQTDTMPPTILINSPLPNDNVNNTLTVNASIDDKLSDFTAGDIDLIYVRLINPNDASQIFDLGTYESANNFGGFYDPNTEILNATYNVPGIVSVGTYKVEVIAVDMFFNSSSAEVTINVQ